MDSRVKIKVDTVTKMINDFFFDGDPKREFDCQCLCYNILAAIESVENEDESP